MMKCPNCGNECEEKVKFCEGCGALIPQEKECPQCHVKLDADARICEDCGYDFQTGRNTNTDPDNVGAKSELKIGDRSVVAGDVISGNKDNRQYHGSVTNSTTSNCVNNVSNTTRNVINETTIVNQKIDESHRIVQCHVCGKNITIDQTFKCPKCGEYTCEHCRAASRNVCVSCSSLAGKQAEEEYLSQLNKILAVGFISAYNRVELAQLARTLGISEERAECLELEARKNLMHLSVEKLTEIEYYSLQKGVRLLYQEGKVAEAQTELEPLLKKYWHYTSFSGNLN